MTQPDRLDRLEAALVNFAELQIRTNVEVSNRISRIERSIENLNITATETFRLIADNSRAIAEQAVQANRDREAWQAEIRRIWEYLLRQYPNGRGEE